MIQLNLENFKKLNQFHSLLEKETKKSRQIINSYLGKIFSREQGFYQIIDEKIELEKIHKFTRKVRGQFSRVIVLGIGGSALGAIALKEALAPPFAVPGQNKNVPSLTVLDNIDPALITEVENSIDYKKTIFLVITKSGGTPETLAQYFYFRKKYQLKKLDQKKHFVFVTDPKKGFLRDIANKENILSFDIPENVGGRFSVLTPVGLLPLQLIGIDTNKLLAGAKKMRDHFFSPHFSGNLPFQLAIIQFKLYQKGKTINVLMPYSQKLCRFADWYRQILAESIGKAKNNQAKTVNVGITPISALGVTDQHSQIQLYNEGPNDKLIIFLSVKKISKPIPIPCLYPDENSIDYLKNSTFNQLFDIEKKATALALNQNNRPNIEIKMDEINAYNLGELIMLFEGATAFLGEFFNINAFDQPGVELGKKLTKEMLLTSLKP